MLELRLVQGSLLKRILEAIKDLVADVNLDCSASGLSLQATDPSEVVVVAVLLRSEAFEHYHCDGSLSIGLNLDKVVKMLKCAGDDDIVSLVVDTGGDSLSITYESPSQDKIADFQVKMMQINSQYLGIPDMECNAIVKMASSEFARICRDLSAIGDSVVISVSKDRVTFTAGSDTATAHIVRRQNWFGNKEEDRTEVQTTEPLLMTFALPYLNLFAKATPLSSRVTLSLTQELPMLVEYTVEDVGYVRFYLAPKLE